MIVELSTDSRGCQVIALAAVGRSRAALLGALMLGCGGASADAEQNSTGGTAGALGMAGLTGAAGAVDVQSSGSQRPAECDEYRDQPGATDLAVVIRNETSAALFVQPVEECNDGFATLVNFQRGTAAVNIRGFIGCGYRSCESVQELGRTEPETCPAACQTAPPLVRLEPGAQLDAGREWIETVDHGISSGTERMPDECHPGGLDPNFGPGVQCFTRIPLPRAEYRISASAYLGLACAPDFPCNCVPDGSGTCVTRTQRGAGTALLSEATLAPAGSAASIVFR